VLFCDIWKISIMSRKILVFPKNFWTPIMVHFPKFFSRRGGGVVKNNFLRKIIFGTKGTNNLKLVKIQ
jgi:hypothetical protein